MAKFEFDAKLFQSQALPEALPDVLAPVQEPVAPVSATAEEPTLDSLTPEQRTYLGANSGFAGIGLIDTPAKVLAHLKLHNEARAQQAALQLKELHADPAYKQQQRELRAGKQAAIDAARAEWKLAVAQRKAAEADWDAYVKAKHDAYTAARDA